MKDEKVFFIGSLKEYEDSEFGKITCRIAEEVMVSIVVMLIGFNNYNLYEMSKLNCHCGNIVSDSMVPCDNAFDLLPDKEYYVFFDKLNEVTSLLNTGNHSQLAGLIERYYSYKNVSVQGDFVGAVNNYLDELYLASVRKVLQCNSCGRLWIQQEHDTYKSYVPE